ncbi:cytochrome C [Alteromonadaceae bacterium M269]|nr:cytochrome C [Alteromonadaceae bacterium M269]
MKLLSKRSFVLALSLVMATTSFANSADELGKQVVESTCTACHSIRTIANSSGYTESQWKELTSTMIDLSANPKLQEQIMGYLAKHYPPNDRRQSKIIAGDGQVSFEQWQVPTLGQRSRDPIEAEDGTLWWAGQWGNLIGRINPKTGEMKEYPLLANSKPHSVTLDAQGNVWYTGNKNGTIGKLDIKTEEITVYHMPDKAAKDPHTAIFAPDGILWFTLQHSNMLGRLDPKSGDIQLKTMPTLNSRPYGIKIDKDGTPWVACNGHNCLAKINTETFEITEINLPNNRTKVRRLDIDDQGNIWYVNSSRGRLGRYNPKTGDIKEWPSPSGDKAHPYAIVIVDGVVWYNESGKRPDALVRFDPKSETFQSWPIPSGNVYAGIIRHMRSTQDGKLLIHQSSTNRIMKVTYSP